jgi:type VI secretion system protein ImpF
MPDNNLPSFLMPSVLDRLIEPISATGPLLGYTVEQMTDAVRRDLEDLLNTRRPLDDVPPGLGEVACSVVAYGVPDPGSLGAVTTQQQEEIGRILEDIIRRFEPRLTAVRVRLVPSAAAVDPALRFHIDARLAVEPAQPVTFETVLRMPSGHTTVQATRT